MHVNNNNPFCRRDCDAINEICCKFYSNHPTKNSKNQFDFRPGDKVCCTKNAEVKDERTHEEVNPRINEKRDKNKNSLRNRPEHISQVSETVSQTKTNDKESVGPPGAEQTGSASQPNLGDKVSGKKANRRLCNGEIFFVKAVSNILYYYIFNLNIYL